MFGFVFIQDISSFVEILISSAILWATCVMYNVIYYTNPNVS